MVHNQPFPTQFIIKISSLRKPSSVRMFIFQEVSIYFVDSFTVKVPPTLPDHKLIIIFI